jgi:peptidoglycan/xylan/chitin deacetylase (PgdA/CDA1 family)
VIEESFRELTDHDRGEKIQLLERVFFPAGGYVPRREEALTWNQVREMSVKGIEFEAHTCTHIDVRYATPDVVAREIARSKRAIEEKIGCQVTGFAYPYGKQVDAYRSSARLLLELGLRWACTAQDGVNSNTTDPYLLKRGSLRPIASRALLHRELILQFCRA